MINKAACRSFEVAHHLRWFWGVSAGTAASSPCKLHLYTPSRKLGHLESNRVQVATVRIL